MVKNKKLIEQIVTQISLERKHALDYRRPREEKWAKTDDLYFGRKKKSLISRANIHLPVLHGAVETLLSKIDGSPEAIFKPTASSDKSRAVFLRKSMELDAKKTHWDVVELYGKKEALMYGRAIEKKYAKRVRGKFEDVRELVLCRDFWIDPMAGGLDPFGKARYAGQDNIIRTAAQLSNKDIYNQSVVKEILRTIKSDNQADSRNRPHDAKKAAQGLMKYAFVSGDAVNLSEGITEVDGVRYYVLFEPNMSLAVRVEILAEMDEYDEFPYSSWAAFTDPEEFWSIAPAELFHDVNYTQNVLVSQLLDNAAQRNYGMKAYDSTKITTPTLLNPRPSGLVPVTGKPSEVIMDIAFPSIGENLQLLSWLSTKTDADTGVTSNARGVPNTKRMSAAEFTGLIDQIADRIYMHNRLYRMHHERICTLYAQGVWQFMTKDRRIEVEGAMGVTNVFRNGKALKFRSDFTVEVQLEDEQRRDSEREQQLAFIARARQQQGYNQEYLNRLEASFNFFDDDDVRRLTTKLPDTDWRSVTEAQEENEWLLDRIVEPNQAATLAHVQEHLDFVRYSRDLSQDLRQRVLEHSRQEMEIASRNAELAVSRALQAENAQTMQNAPVQPQPQVQPQQ